MKNKTQTFIQHLNQTREFAANILIMQILMKNISVDRARQITIRYIIDGLLFQLSARILLRQQF